jgi:hypothetical protein
VENELELAMQRRYLGFSRFCLCVIARVMVNELDPSTCYSMVRLQLELGKDCLHPHDKQYICDHDKWRIAEIR